MKNDKIVTINGQKYDSLTGMPVKQPASNPEITNTVKTNQLQTHHAIKLRSNIVKKTGHRMDITRSKKVSHFAPHSVKTPTKPSNQPIEPKAEKLNDHKIKPAPKPAVHKSAKTIKQEAIAEALSKTPKKSIPKNNFFKRHSKFINIFSIGVVLLIIIGYFTYLNMPSISVRIASAQAGINATYPEYHPDGYSISGPVAYTADEVTINFHANTGSSKFVIKQSKSTWDSSALKIQVDKNSKNVYMRNRYSHL